MRNFITLFICLLVFTGTYAQQPSEEAISKLSTDTCTCIEKIDNIKTEAQAELELGKCMAAAYGKDVKYYNSQGLDFMNEAILEEFGEAVGLNMVANCPSFLEIFINMDYDDEETGDSYETFEEITGSVQKLTSDSFSVLTIKDDNGRQHKVLWLTYVDNGDLLRQAIEDKKTYTFRVRELDIYDPRIEEYRNMYVLDRID
ncbi:hypothetical protein [Nonlabens xiamenensis]|uniref:hypothetical protein n=1 Tax=Nonlabens xiamenensis TaxID=2341043 RepID=UPI000F6094A8|nr:hypothetical protein [Nonlabens xiamenensis]